MVSNVVSIQLIQNRSRWDFASYNPSYDSALKAIRESSHAYYPLGELVTSFKYGASIPADYIDQGILFIRAQNIREHGVDLSDTRYVSEDTPGLEGHFAETGDILITRSGINVGDAVSIPPFLAGSAHGSYSIRLRLKNEIVSPEYLAIVINSSVVRAQIKAFKGRSAQPNINIAELSRLQILLPPRPTQERIAQVMQEAYAAQRAKLAGAEKLLNTANEFVLKELDISTANLKDEKRFLVNASRIAGQRFDISTYNTKYAGLILELQNKFGPNLVSLRSISYPITSGATPLGSNYTDEGIVFLRVQNISNDGSIDFNNTLFVSPKFAKTIERSAIQNDDLLLVIVGATIGKCAVAKNISFPVVPNQAIARIRVREDVAIDPDFLQAFLRSQAGQIQIDTLKRPVAQGNLNLTEAGQILVPHVPPETQKAIVEAITHRRAEAKRLRAEAEQVVTNAKAQVERMILGEEDA